MKHLLRWPLRASLAGLFLVGCSALQTPEPARQWLLDVDYGRAQNPSGEESNGQKSGSQKSGAQKSSTGAVSVQWPRISAPYDQDYVWIADQAELIALKGVRWRADTPVLLRDAVQTSLLANSKFASVRVAPEPAPWLLHLSTPDFRAVRSDAGYAVSLRLAWRLECFSDGQLERDGLAEASAEAVPLLQLQGAFKDAVQEAALGLSQSLSTLPPNTCH